MNNRRFNVHYITADGVEHVTYNHFLAAALSWANTILAGGGRITGIIDSEKDL